MNIYFVFALRLESFTVGQDFMLKDSLLGAIKLTTNVDPDKYEYSSYGIVFDATGRFSLSYGSGFGKSVIIFGYI